MILFALFLHQKFSIGLIVVVIRASINKLLNNLLFPVFRIVFLTKT